MEDTNEINAEDITFSQNAQLKALVAKNITVIENICVKFYGIIRGDLILKKGSKMLILLMKEVSCIFFTQIKKKDSNFF